MGLKLLKGSDIRTAAKRIEFAINAGNNRILGFSAYEILNKSSFLDPLSRPLEITSEAIEQSTRDAGVAGETRRNRNRKTKETFAVGDLVFVLNFQRDKLADHWLGPFQIIGVKANKNSFLIDQGLKTSWFNLKHIKPAYVITSEERREGQDVVPYNITETN